MQTDRVFDEVSCVAKPASLDDVIDEFYLGANPDVRLAGLSAREHFEQHGQAEGRLQWANLQSVSKLRQTKLERVRFSREPVKAQQPGRAICFVTPAMAQEFDLPEHPPVSANQYSDYFANEIRANADLLYLDVGAGLRFSYFSNVVNTEIYDSISTDVVCLAEDLSFESDQFDYVICASVLEHTRRPWQAAEELIRVLKPGGRLLIDWPFLQAVHGYPHHYFNATPQGVISLFKDQCDITSCTVNSNQHPIFVLYWVMAIWRSGLDAENAAAFDRLTVADILARMPDMQLDLPYCRTLPAAFQDVIGASSTLLARKRTRTDPAISRAPRTFAAETFSRLRARIGRYFA